MRAFLRLSVVIVAAIGIGIGSIALAGLPSVYILSGVRFTALFPSTPRDVQDGSLPNLPYCGYSVGTLSAVPQFRVVLLPDPSLASTAPSAGASDLPSGCVAGTRPQGLDFVIASLPSTTYTELPSVDGYERITAVAPARQSTTGRTVWIGDVQFLDAKSAAGHGPRLAAIAVAATQTSIEIFLRSVVPFPK